MKKRRRHDGRDKGSTKMKQDLGEKEGRFFTGTHSNPGAANFKFEPLFIFKTLPCFSWLNSPYRLLLGHGFILFMLIDFDFCLPICINLKDDPLKLGFSSRQMCGAPSFLPACLESPHSDRTCAHPVDKCQGSSPDSEGTLFCSLSIFNDCKKKIKFGPPNT